MAGRYALYIGHIIKKCLQEVINIVCAAIALLATDSRLDEVQDQRL